jgi:hypothetical protein
MLATYRSEVKAVETRRRVKGLALAGMVTCLLLAVLAAGAVAGSADDDSASGTFLMPENIQAESGEPQGAATPIAPMADTNADAAQALGHEDLDRAEAAHLLQAVFEESLDAPSGIYGDLQVEHFHSDHVAVVDDADPHNGLLQSLLPLRDEDGGGGKEVVDLDLVPAGDGDLEPSNPLVQLTIPSELGDGIALPESSIHLTLEGAPAERVPSVIDGGAAFFPNVAQDSDFTVVPTPTGVETFSHLRTPDAPLSQTYDLTLPAGAVLEERPDGGAKVTRDGAIMAVVQAPTAIDAAGASVPVSLAVNGDSLTVTSAPGPDSAYPILVDPVVETYYWSLNNHTDGIGDWTKASNSPLFEARDYGYGGAEKGLNIYSYAGTVQAGAQANWNYHVPRYYSDQANYGGRPSSFITKMSLSSMNFWIESGSAPYPDSPFVVAGLWDEANNWFVQKAVRTGSENSFFNAKTDLANPSENVGVKEGGIALHAGSDTQSRPRHLWVGQASVEVSDKDYPGFIYAQGPAKWVNGSNASGGVTEPIDFEASDLGLGVYAILAKTPKAGGGTNQWEQTAGCPGNARTPCPRVWKGGFWNFNPKLMPQGENVVELIAKDPVWHFSDQQGLQKLVKVKVDRTEPSLALSGSLTEQTTVGNWQQSYLLKMDLADGTSTAPQSGAAKVAVKVDGAVVYESNPGCATKNCAFSREWTLDADDFSYGLHLVEVIATDAVGMQKVSSFYVTTHGDQTDPSVALSGTMTQQGTLGTTRPSYKLKVAATDPGSTEERKSGVASTTVKVDGTVVDSASPGCTMGGCSITREWTLNSDSYPVGAHNVEVKATDEAGRTTTKALTINIARDNTPPQLTATSPFYTAPEGWVEHKAYNYLSTATDNNGYGVTSFSLKIDGDVVKEASGACPAGACTRYLGLGSTIDMTTLDGGAHPAELVASDGAGNTAKRTWTINVDPAGNIAVGEATDTLEAVEETAPEATELTPVDGLVTEVVGEGGVNPQLTPENGELVSEATPTPSTVSIDPQGGYSIETTAANEDEVLEQDNIEVVPLQVGPSASDAALTDGSAAVISNSATNVDTILRPAYDGLMAFQSIRDTVAPESYSWEVKLGEGETLKSIDQKHAGIFWEDGTQAMLISGQSAHGADGKAVATSLSVSEGNVLTLTVAHRVSGVVYPVVAGVGWEGGFVTSDTVIKGPKEEQEEKEAEEKAKEEEAGETPPPPPYEGSWGYSSPPKLALLGTLDPNGTPSTLDLPVIDINYWWHHCAYNGPGGCKPYELVTKSPFFFNRRYVWWKSPKPNPACFKNTNGFTADLTFCQWVGKNHEVNYGGYHITSRGVWDIAPAGGPFESEEPVSVYMYPSGYAKGHNTFCVCNPSN